MDEQGAFERQFYLEHFRGRSIVLSAVEHDATPVRAMAATLAAAGVRVVVVHGRVDAPGHAVVGPGIASDTWLRMRQRNPALLEVGDHPHEAAVALSGHLRPFKLVLVDDRVPAHDDRPAPFVTIGPPAAAGAPEGPLAHLAARALAAGVGSVNACSAEALEQELLTYRGAGVLYTAAQYCTVGPLRLDDFEAAERLIGWGVAEGFLKARAPADVAELLLAGYGARFGDEHLAGVAALRTTPYAEDRMGEVAALTTISRFAGGGVGGMIVRRILADAPSAGLSAVFACTTSTAAARFFTALGFEEVPHAAIPQAKWEGYDPERRSRVIALRHGLAGIP